jgi:hypothetical protein
LENQSQKTKNRHRKYSFLNRSITDWNLLPEVSIGPSNGKTNPSKTRVRKVKNSEGKRKI